MTASDVTAPAGIDAPEDVPGPALTAAAEERQAALQMVVERREVHAVARRTMERVVHKHGSAGRRLARVTGGHEEPPEGLSVADLESRRDELEAYRGDAEATAAKARRKLQNAVTRLQVALDAEQAVWSADFPETADDPSWSLLRGRWDARAALAQAEIELAESGSAGAPRSEYSHLRRFAATLIRHCSTYVSGQGLVYLIGLVQTLIVIQFLPPGQFGSLALVGVGGAFVTLPVMLLFKRGAVNRTFGDHADLDDDGDDDGDDDDEMDDARDGDRIATARDPRRSLGTGIILILGGGMLLLALVGAAGTGLHAATGWPDNIHFGWLLLGGGVSLFALVFNMLLIVPRMARRPALVVATTASRPLIAMALVVGLLVAGGGVTAVLVGQIVGGLLACALAMVVHRSAYRLRFDPHEVVPIVKMSARRWRRNASMWTLHSGDVLLMGTMVGTAGIGTYRLASRLTTPLMVPANVFFIAWLPLERASVVRAAYQIRGRQHVRGIVLPYLAVLVSACLLALLAGVDLLRLVVPASYDRTIGLLPLLVFAMLARILLHAVHRFGRMSNRRIRYDRTLMAAAIFSVPATLGGVALAGPGGAAIGNGVAMLFATGVLWWLSQRGPAPLPVDWPRLGATVGLAVACGVAAHVGGRAVPGATLVFDLAALVGFLILIFALGVIPREHRTSLRRVRQDVVRRRADDEITERLEALSPEERGALRGALERVDAHEPREFGEPFDAATTQRLVAGFEVLRRCAGTPVRPPEQQALIARYLFGDISGLERLHAGRHLYADHVPPDEMATLERWREDARRAMGAGAPAGRDIPPSGN